MEQPRGPSVQIAIPVQPVVAPKPTQGWRPGERQGTAPMTGAERNPYGSAPPPVNYPMKLGGNNGGR